MRIIIAGAGAGKTTKMARDALTRYKQIESGKIIYVITYTNAARDHIRSKIIEEIGNIPGQIKVETSHVFLLQEIIFPFYHLLYNQQYSSVSALKLPDNLAYKAKKLKELKQQNIIHVEEFTSAAKNVIYGKSNDKKVIKEKRNKIISIMKDYLDSVFIDEAQDMDENLSKIIQILYINGFNVQLVGDPKQDLRGSNELRKLIEGYPQCIEYVIENHRCPITHVKLSNLYVPEKEKQEYQTGEIGVINTIYESDIDINDYLINQNWDYVYISKKNDRFSTDSKQIHSQADSLNYELKLLAKKANIEDKKINQMVFLIVEYILENLNSKNNREIINKIGEFLTLKFTKQDYARLCSVLDLNRENKLTEGLVVNSIDKVKGLEGERCLFILTTDLSDYLFQIKKEQNKMLNYLYVSLTRSKKELVILITEEVEKKHGCKWINTRLEELLEATVGKT